MLSNFSRVFCAVFLFMLAPGIVGAITLKQRQLGGSTGGEYYSDYDYSSMDSVPGTDGMDEMEVVQTLRHDIQALDEQIATCERKRKGWVAATVIGGAGVVGTGIAAIVQGSKIKEKKSDLEQVKGNVTKKEQQLQQAKKDLEELQ